jgi:hypothetical protein
MTTATNFTVKVIEVGTTSPDLAPLAGREYDKQYTALPNANLPKAMRLALDKVFIALTGEELPLEENTFLIKAEDGIYSRLFGPILKAGNDEVEGTSTGSFTIQWGNRYIPVTLGKEGLGVEINGQPVQFEAEFCEFNFSGRFPDPCLMVSIDEEDGSGQTAMPIAVRFIDFKTPPEIKVLNSLLKKNKADEIIPLVQEVTPRGSGGTRSTCDSEIDFRDLEIGEYSVIGYRSANTKFGTSYRIVINDYPENTGQTAETWAHTSLRSLLATSPEITPEKPALLHIRDKEVTNEGKTRIRCTLILSRQEEVNPDSLDLNFG